MGSGMIGGMITAGIAAANAANKLNQGKKPTGSGSSGGTQGSGTSGGSYSYGNITSNGNGSISQADYDTYTKQAADAASNWHSASSDEDKTFWHRQAIEANQKLGKSYDDKTGLWYGSGYTVEPGQEQVGWNTLQDKLDEWNEKNNDATRAAIAQGKLTLQQQLPGIQQDYEEAARQAYIQYMNAKKDLPQQLAAAGISGQGAAESTISGQANNYNNILSRSELARQNAERSISDSIANLEATGNLQYAQNASDISKTAFGAYQNYLAQQQSQANADRDFALNQAGLTGMYQGRPTLGWQQQQNANRQTDASIEAQAQDRAWQRFQEAVIRWQMNGTVANDEDAALLGVPRGTANADERFNIWKRQLGIG